MKQLPALILVVDDELDALELITFNLREAGFNVSTAEDGPTALAKARESLPDAIVLDVMLPEMDGFEVCGQLRNDPKTAHIPIVMLTAKASEMDRVLGLEMGADDYLSKPFSPRELVLRVKILLRRRVARQESGRLCFGELVIDVLKHEITVADRIVTVTLTEFKLLTLLAKRASRLQSREQLLNEVWGYENAIDTRTVDTHIRSLRQKLGSAARHVQTVRGAGYRFIE